MTDMKTRKTVISEYCSSSDHFQVIAEALKVFNLDLIPLSSPRARTFRDNPTYVCLVS